MSTEEAKGASKALNKTIGEIEEIFDIEAFGDRPREQMDDLVDQLRDMVIKIASDWYRTGAKRGAIETFKAIRSGKFTVADNGDSIEITALSNVRAITWWRRLRVRVGDGNNRWIVPAKTYRLSLRQLGLD